MPTIALKFKVVQGWAVKCDGLMDDAMVLNSFTQSKEKALAHAQELQKANDEEQRKQGKVVPLKGD